jgi:predicted MPP superfamily phosphohydrolase
MRSLGINALVIVVAVAMAAVSTAVAVVALRRSNEQQALAVATLVAAVLMLISVLAFMAIYDRDPFALIHLCYVVLTVGVPLAGLGVLALTPRHTQLWFRVFLGLMVLLAPIGFYASHIEPFWLRVDRAELAVESGAPGLRIGVFSDLQTDSIDDYEEMAVDRLIAEQPDIVLIPGDVWQMPAADFDAAAPAFSRLLSRICDEAEMVFVVNGNTDNVAGLRRIVAGTDAVLLDNEVVEFSLKGAQVRVLGITLEGDAQRLAQARTQFVTATTDAIQIVLAHHPDEIYGFDADDPIDLFVAGHSHGGQIAFPLIGPPVTFSSVPRSVAAGGLHEVNDHAVYVSTGVGRERANAPQVRFGVRPSIGVIDLRSGP